MSSKPQKTPNSTKAVAGSMSLRNRAVVTSVFWGARPRENQRERRARLAMSQQPCASSSSSLPSSSTSSSSSAPDEHDFMTMADCNQVLFIVENMKAALAPLPQKMCAERARQVRQIYHASLAAQRRASQRRATPVVDPSQPPPRMGPDVSVAMEPEEEIPKVLDASEEEQKPLIGELLIEETSVEDIVEDMVEEDVRDVVENLLAALEVKQEVPETSEEPEEPEDLLEVTQRTPEKVKEEQVEAEEPEEVAMIKKGKRAYTRKVFALEPVRKSRRINKEQKQNDDELLANFHNGQGVMSRGTRIPCGLTRQPFRFKDLRESMESMKAARVKDQLKIDMEPVFTPAGALSQGFPDERKRPTPEPLAITTGFMEKDSGEIRTGAQFQALIDDDVIPRNADEEPDRDELVWSPPDEEIECNFDTLQDSYWRPIWRQFEGRIPMETALEHLMKHRYIFSDSLNTIDETLKVLPQEFKPLSCSQQRQFEALLKKKSTTRRILQQGSMKNYHIAEVQNYHYASRKFLKFQKKYGVPCNCEEKLCEDLLYEERWACPNCTAHLRTQPPVNKDSLLCLICQTYEKLTGKWRPTHNVVFSEEEHRKIREWALMEDTEGVIMDKMEYLKRSKEARIARWKRNELSAEEMDMLDPAGLRIQNRKHKYTLTEEEKRQRGELVAAQLEPYLLPHFTKCNCQLEARDLKASEEKEKLQFVKKEQHTYSGAIRTHEECLKKVAQSVEKKVFVVDRFLMVHAGEGDVAHLVDERQFIDTSIPPSNLPPTLPVQVQTSTSTSRDNTPPTPDGQPPAKRRRCN